MTEWQQLIQPIRDEIRALVQEIAALRNFVLYVEAGHPAYVRREYADRHWQDNYKRLLKEWKDAANHSD